MTKIKVHKTLVRPAVTFGSETWTFTKKEENSLRSFERKIVRRVFGPVNGHQRWRIRSNNELFNLIGGQDVGKIYKSSKTEMARTCKQMPETRTPIRILEGRLYNRRRKGRPKLRWMDGVSKDLEIMGLRGWTDMVKDRVRWNAVVKEAKTQRPPEAAGSLDRPPWNIAKRRWMASATSTRGGPTRGRSFASDRQGGLGEVAEAGRVYGFLLAVGTGR
ncbi:hypothetical protein ANN_19757 [Periplaneta americana]|uniref:Uncharacterized protein n=1 Tax=Periplaneta americana TaxID=6978 RepID=A0ABQ8SB34_PERAM|nr:hypothetical protein ANN_19757 [Periplaneta americana]